MAFMLPLRHTGAGLAAAMVVAAVPFVPSHAQAPQVTQAEGRAIYLACRQDIQRYCANVQRGEGRIAMCMRDNEQNLSPSCKAAVKTAFDPEAGQ